MPKRPVARWVAVVFCCIAWAHSINAAHAAKIHVGILPVFNAGGDPFAPVFNENLTLMIFHELQNSAVTPVLLNPGGLYNPSDDEWIVEYARKTGVTAVVITSLLKTDTPSIGNWKVMVQGEILDLSSEKRSPPWTMFVAMNKRDVQLDYGRDVLTYGEIDLNSQSSRRFEKQPLGKAAHSIAEQVSNHLLQEIRPKGSSPSPGEPPKTTAGSCNIDFKIRYSSKHAASKSYTVFVNGTDESFNIQEGVLPLAVRPGDLLLKIKINDAPYKLPKQDVYEASSYIDCSRPEHILLLDIGAAGEGFLHWE